MAHLDRGGGDAGGGGAPSLVRPDHRQGAPGGPGGRSAEGPASARDRAELRRAVRLGHRADDGRRRHRPQVSRLTRRRDRKTPGRS